MRGFARFVALGFSALFAASAGASPFSATLSFEVGTLDPVFFVGAGSGTSSPAAVTVPAGIFAGTGGNPLLFSVAVASQQVGAFTGTPLQGPMPIDGTLHYNVDVPLLGTGGGVGIGGTAMGPGFTAYFHPFSAATPTLKATYSYHVAAGAIASMTIMSVVYWSDYFTGTDSRTPGGLGQITLVSPILIRFDGGGGCISCFLPPSAAVLTVSFVPEPGTLALLGTGMLGLCAYGRRRLRRRLLSPL